MVAGGTGALGQAPPAGPHRVAHGGGQPDLFAAQLSCLDSANHVADEAARLVAFLKVWHENWAEATRARQCLYLSSLELQLALGFLGMLAVGTLGLVWVMACRRRRPIPVPAVVQGPVAHLPLRAEGVRLRRIRAGTFAPGGPTDV